MLTTDIIEQCKRNDRKAQLQLYNKYCDGMYYVAFRFLKDAYEAEEAMHEGFINAFSKLHQFTGEVTFGAWLKRIVINKSLDMIKAKRATIIPLNEEVMGKVDDDPQDWSIDDNVTVEHIKKTIAALPEKYEYPLMLFLIEGYDHQEIAEILNITEVASRTLVHRGKKKLQQQLKVNNYGTGY
ncbi:sigma-70 family RNA polymerase sigma factor [Dokdonia sinensis]|uniref:Sigma-70 family RNA polymerase sigma factor n=1 Tax=Dokdonia sinensis TaxID=2479847 RepID=A0A3M0GHQ7_9FLAO|nr:sigma-70 family RNA polymerase sigma factor [Dokdonia sinensis]RMB60599.1 sigma-70 family RNA polymerase sigma factor [Dokdonia sinensis]